MDNGACTDLPLRRSFSPDAIGRGAAIFSFHGKRRLSEVSVPTLVGGLARAQGAPLGSTEFDVLTIALRMFARRGAPTDGWMLCSKYQLVTAVYGYSGGRPYSLVGRGLQNLWNVSVTLPFDAESGQFTARARTKERLIRRVVLRNDAGEIDADSSSSDFWDDLASNGSGTASVKIQFEDWLVAAVRAEQGLELDYGVQRALRGSAKTCWVLLHWAQFQPTDEPGVEQLGILLDRHVYSVFGLNSRRLTDSRGHLENNLRQICDRDPTYLGYEIVPFDGDLRQRVLIVRRATGQRRQRLLRAALLQDAGVPERPPQLQLGFSGAQGGGP